MEEMMCGKLSGWLHRSTTGWVALGALVVFLAFTALVLPGQSAQADMGAEDVGSPDLSFFYSPAELYQMADAYGPEGRREYIRARFTFDVAWPIVYTLFLTTAISWLFGRSLPTGSRWQLANLAPIVGALFDYLENVSTSLVMARYPARTPVVDVLAPIFTLVKWIFVGGSFVLLFAGIAAAIWRVTRRRTSTR
jgi:hypothetical protein